MSKDYEKIAQLIPQNINELRSCLEKYNNDAKPLGEQNQEKVRKFMHKLYSKYNSWVADGIVRWHENETSAEQIEKELSGATSHFAPQSAEKIDEAIENINFSFVDRGKYNKRQNIEKTFYVCADNVLSRNEKSLVELSEKVYEKDNAKEDAFAVGK